MVLFPWRLPLVANPLTRTKRPKVREQLAFMRPFEANFVVATTAKIMVQYVIVSLGVVRQIATRTPKQVATVAVEANHHGRTTQVASVTHHLDLGHGASNDAQAPLHDVDEPLSSLTQAKGSLHMFLSGM